MQPIEMGRRAAGGSNAAETARALHEDRASVPNLRGSLRLARPPAGQTDPAHTGNDVIRAVCFDAFGTLVEITDKRRPCQTLLRGGGKESQPGKFSQSPSIGAKSLRKRANGSGRRDSRRSHCVQRQSTCRAPSADTSRSLRGRPPATAAINGAKTAKETA
jgi:hypothetical protein